MKKTLLRLFIIIATTTVFLSCAKYDDNQFISLRSKNSRIVGTWKFVKSKTTTSENGETKVEEIFDGDSVYVINRYLGDSKKVKWYKTRTINEDGAYIDEFPSYDTLHCFREGYWSWEKGDFKKEKIELLLPDFNETIKYTILKLTNKELILSNDNAIITYKKI